MPLSSFRRLADEMPKNPTKILFIHNLSRSGSTLVSSVFAHTGRAVALAEPRALDTVCMLYGKTWNESDSKVMLMDVVRLLSKPVTNCKEKPLLYAIKPASTDIPFANVLQELFPTSVSVFTYRDLTEIVVSTRGLAATGPSAVFAILLIEFGNASIRSMALNAVGISGKAAEGFRPQSQPFIEFLYFSCMNMIRHYHTLRDKGVNITGVRYEDLRDRPETMIPKLLDLAGIPRQYVSQAMTAMEKDSQEHCQISRQKLAPFKAKYRANFFPSQQLLDHVQAQYDRAGIPGPKELSEKNFRLPGSIVP